MCSLKIRIEWGKFSNSRSRCYRFSNCFKPYNICIHARSVPAALRNAMNSHRSSRRRARRLRYGERNTLLQRTHIDGQDQFKFALLPRSRVRDTPLDPTPNTGNSGLLGWTALGFRFIRSIRDPCPTAGITPGDRSWLRSESVSMFNRIILIGFVFWPRHREMTRETIYLRCRANLLRYLDNHSIYGFVPIERRIIGNNKKLDFIFYWSMYEEIMWP